jgi:hypothetical protein
MMGVRVHNGRIGLRGTIALLLAVACWAPEVRAQQRSQDKPEVELVTAAGCANRAPDGVWTLTNASETTAVKTAATTPQEIDAARARPLGKGRYRLIGTADFVTAEELLQQTTRAQVTTKDSVNTSSQLRNGGKVVVRGLLIDTPSEKRINLTSVQLLADTCK